jgi:hypothetical protein
MAVAMTSRPSWPYQPAPLARRRAQIADTWTYIAAAYFGV